jgi:hypothetical protein
MRLFHEVEERYSGLVGALQAVIVGPHYDVKKYVPGALDNNYNLYAGDYVPGRDNVFPWPNRQAGGIVDLENVAVHVDDAWVKYWDGAASAATVRMVTGTRTRLRSSSVNWATYHQYPRSVLLPQRDVAVGDGVRVRIPAAGVDMYTKVTGFAHDLVAASVGAVTPDSSNKAASAASASGNIYFSTGTPPAITVDGSSYDGLADGILTEVFTITVTQSATGGDNDTAVLLVMSDSGINEDNVQTTSGAIDPSLLRGLALEFDSSGEFEVGQTWRVTATSAYAVPAITLSGDYTGGLDTTYVVRVVVGGVVGSAVRPPVLTVDTVNGVDRERVDKTLDDVSFLIGNYGVEAAVPAGTTFYAGDQFTFDCAAQQNGAVSTLILANSLPENVTDAMPVQVDLYLVKDIDVDPVKKGQAPYLNYSSDLRNVTLSPEITYFEETMVDNANAEIRMLLERGRVHVEYRSLLQTYSNSTHELAQGGDDLTSILDNIRSVFGYHGPENPIAYGCYIASLNSGGTPVLYVAVKSDDLEGYAAAMGKLDARSGTYGIVPLTQDPEILAYIQAEINVAAQPENCRWRKGWFTREFSDQQGIMTTVDGQAQLVKIVSRIEDNGKFITVEMPDGRFITDGVRPGDLLRFNYRSDGYAGFTYDSYEVDHVLSEDSLKLVDGPDRGYDIAMKAEIWRTLMPSEVAKQYAQFAGSYHDKRINLVWPPKAPANGQDVPGYYVCAALAALRSGVLPHQGLTNVEVRGFDDMPLTTDYLGEPDLNVMAASGVWIVTTDLDTGEVYTRHQLTTAGYDDIKRREDSVISNWDSISYRLRNLYRKYIGTSNLTREFVTYFRNIVDTDLRNIRNTTAGTDVLRGPQIEDYEIVEFKIHDMLPDALVCRVRFTGPHPFNNFDMYMIF